MFLSFLSHHQVVENKAVAKECINYLRDQRVGTCVFLPLDNVNTPPLSEKVRSFGERYKPCLHLLKFDEQYKVSDTNSGVHFKWSFKHVGS